MNKFNLLKLSFKVIKMIFGSSKLEYHPSSKGVSNSYLYVGHFRIKKSSRATIGGKTARVPHKSVVSTIINKVILMITRAACLRPLVWYYHYYYVNANLIDFISFFSVIGQITFSIGTCHNEL